MSTTRFDATSYYLLARSNMLASGGFDEIEWQRTRNPYEFTEQDLLREGAWVILCSGFRESVVRRKFSYISVCFGDWESARGISENADLCVATAAYAIANESKLRAIVELANTIDLMGFATFREILLRSPAEVLQSIPFIGRVTSRHLMKNLGFNVPKPDRHLVRLADLFGYETVDRLCADISEATGDPINIIDLVLWRQSVRA